MVEDFWERDTGERPTVRSNGPHSRDRVTSCPVSAPALPAKRGLL
jgi:hypothetical protein